MTNLKGPGGLPQLILLDHDDSFTMNIKMWLNPEFDVHVVHHLDFDTGSLPRYVGLVLSPGPMSPNDYPKTLNLLRQIPDHYPVFGICLGLQMLCHLEGAKISRYAPPLHGKVSVLNSDLSEFQNVSVARYHSLFIDPVPACYDVVATSEGLPMWLNHNFKKRMGFQFHPESFLTQKQNHFLQIVKSWINA